MHGGFIGAADTAPCLAPFLCFTYVPDVWPEPVVAAKYRSLSDLSGLTKRLWLLQTSL
jgi:hypothetical protein